MESERHFVADCPDPHRRHPRLLGLFRGCMPGHGQRLPPQPQRQQQVAQSQQSQERGAELAPAGAGTAEAQGSEPSSAATAGTVAAPAGGNGGIRAYVVRVPPLAVPRPRLGSLEYARVMGEDF